MRALTLTQPWASLIIWGEKFFETRSWPTKYRGPIAIHAAKGFPYRVKQLARSLEPFRSILAKHGITDPDQLPTGAILGVTSIASCDRTEAIREKLSPLEIQFGDYSDGRYAFCTGTVRKCHTPVPCPGALAIWHVSDHTAAEVLRQIEEARLAT